MSLAAMPDQPPTLGANNIYVNSKTPLRLSLRYAAVVGRIRLRPRERFEVFGRLARDGNDPFRTVLMRNTWAVLVGDDMAIRSRRKHKVRISRMNLKRAIYKY